MVAQWFYQTVEGQESGPIDTVELRRLVATGLVKSNTLVRRGYDGSWVLAENVEGLLQLSASDLTSAETKVAADTAFSPAIARGEYREQKLTGAPISKTTEQSKRYLIQLLVCFLLLAGVFLAIFLLDAKGEVAELFVRGLSLAILVFGGGILVATFRLFRNGGNATWEAARMLWVELQTKDQVSPSSEAHPTVSSKPVSERVHEKTTRQTSIATSGPSATKPPMRHTDPFVPRQRDAYEARPKVMKPEQQPQGFLPRVILATFAASWLCGAASLLLAFGMGFESGYSTSDKNDVADRVGHGFAGGFLGVLAGFMGILAFVLVVDLVSWTTGIQIRDISFIRRWNQE